MKFTWAAMLFILLLPMAIFGIVPWWFALVTPALGAVYLDGIK